MLIKEFIIRYQIMKCTFYIDFFLKQDFGALKGGKSSAWKKTPHSVKFPLIRT